MTSVIMSRKYGKILAFFFDIPERIRVPNFALPIAIVAKCEEIINLAQKIVIWRQLLAKEKSLAKIFVWRRNVTS